MATTANVTTIPILSRPKQTAEHFQVSIMTLHRWSKQPGFPTPIKRGQIVLHDTSAIAVWLSGGDDK
ncbi:hypothetical protein SAMN05216271_3587 [Halopseudomonas sabulinigri]|uniref:DNA-binding protein n=1 Tax=Halopseudomonas sabulinigri TaxID=472181 RepID=A0A1H1XMV2_9GAMM|nr:hypothetical protein SAMN05216271_3587 [Halopseudomonas sabulinigri]